MLKIVCISDTHNFNEQISVPDGDILIHAGDATIRGTQFEVEEFLQWFSSLPHKYKIFVAGNHDWLYETNQRFARFITANFNVKYLQDSLIEIEGLIIYGSPWQPRFYDWAFNLNRGKEIAEKWNLIPDATDVLITHGPPQEILDLTPGGDSAGCEELRKRIEKLNLKAHIFGHIHSGYGTIEKFGIKFVNASICDESYSPSNSPIIIDI
jgi:Icc-related predicted phosphoesterase